MDPFQIAHTDNVYFSHQGTISETRDAVQFSIRGNRVWLPRSQLRVQHSEYLGIPKWLAQTKNLKPDW